VEEEEGEEEEEEENEDCLTKASSASGHPRQP